MNTVEKYCDMFKSVQCEVPNLTVKVGELKHGVNSNNI